MQDFPASSVLWLIPALPLLGAVVNGLIALLGSGSAHGPDRRLVATIGTVLPAIAFVLTLASLGHLAYLDRVISPAPGACAPFVQQTLWHWFSVGALDVSFGLRFDHLSGFMLAFVLGIGTLIHLYSAGYMAQDRGLARFFSYLNLFLFSMVMLVLGDGVLTTFLGWEGVGLCSYLLIGFWHQEAANNDAARKAFIVNRIGDLALLLGVFALLAAMGSQASLDYSAIRAWAISLSGAEQAALTGLLTTATLLIFVGCTGKSAQIPLFTWLPDAMAGPTPVSALIHAATMVTAGIYLCARLSDVFVMTPMTQQIILVTAVATALYAAIIGLLQWDIKKILAYSTVSQLGFMFMAVGVGAWDVALFHVFTHAFFKATLFLGAGSVIHAMHHEQDVRRMGGLAKSLPLTHIAMVAGWYAIIGLPLGSGFASKDLILERLAGHGHLLGWTCWALALCGALLTAIYMTRMMYFVFWSPARPEHGSHHHIVPVPSVMSLPVAILALGSLVVGGLWLPLAHDAPLAVWLSRSLEGAQQRLAGGAEHHMSTALTLILSGLAVSAAVVGVLIARAKYRQGPASAVPAPLTRGPAAITWAFDRAYHVFIVRPMGMLGTMLGGLDRVLFGGANQLLTQFVLFIGVGYRTLQFGRMRLSLAFSLLAVVVILAAVLADPMFWSVP